MRNKYSEKHLKFIIENVKNTEKKLVEMFNETFEIKITVGILGNIKTKLGIRSGMIGGRFEKGHKAFNKGKKWSDYMNVNSQENCRETTFKKGNQPHNHRPVGSERITKDGYLEIKIAEPNKWQRKHRFVYEQKFGKIPRGYTISFADGNKLNFDLDNLMLVKRAENLIMNRMALYCNHAECTKSGLLVVKVIEKVGHISKLKE